MLQNLTLPPIAPPAQASMPNPPVPSLNAASKPLRVYTPLDLMYGYYAPE